MTEPPISYKRHRFPPQIIAHAVWLYFRFPLSLRLIEELLLERGIAVYYETVRHWAMKFGLDYARRLKRKKPGRRDIWHLDEIVQVRRNTRAAKRLLERLLRKQGCPPKRMITDKLGSYGAARRKIMPKVEHRQHKGLNNRAEHSHVPIRKRERAMQGFRSWSGLQNSSKPSPPSAIFSFPLDHIAPHSPPICIASRRWRSGNPSHVQSREISGAGLFTTSAC